jgi:hypothetical protein
MPSEPGTKSATAAQSFAANMKAAGQLVAKQAERTKIVQVTLTTAYFALGKSLYASGTLRNEFPEAFKAVDDLLNTTNEMDIQAAGRTPGEGFAAKAKAAGQAAMDMAQKKKLQVQANYALSTLGKLAFEKLGEQCDSPDVVQPIVDAQARLSAIDAELAQLSEMKSGSVLTPKRMLVAAALLLVLGGGALVMSGMGGASRSGSSGTSHSTASGAPSHGSFRATGPTSAPPSGADKYIENMRRAGTSTRESERNMRELHENFQKAMSRPPSR